MTRADEIFGTLAARLLADPTVSEARMFGSPGLKVGGKVFAIEVKGRLVVKLPRARVEALVAEGAGEPFDPGHGRLMKEWVAVPPSAADWLSLAREAHDFVCAQGGRAAPIERGGRES